MCDYPSQGSDTDSSPGGMADLMKYLMGNTEPGPVQYPFMILEEERMRGEPTASEAGFKLEFHLFY